MYKIFSGEKCIMISGKESNLNEKQTKLISFSSSEALHKEYNQFIQSSGIKKLVITGSPEITWRAFRSLFSYIEAAGGLVKNGKGDLLMIYRNGRWDLPKGRVEPGESYAETALREVEEECTVKQLKTVKQLPMSHHLFSLNNVKCLKRTYWYEMMCKDPALPRPQASEGIEQAKWMSREEVKKIRYKVYPSLQELLSISFSGSE